MPGAKIQKPNAVVMGFLLGINICPPFLLSLSYVASLGDILKSVLYFVIFFFASSVYFIPMVFVGMLARIKELQKTAQVSGIMAAGIFMYYGAYSIISNLYKFNVIPY